MIWTFELVFFSLLLYLLIIIILLEESNNISTKAEVEKR